MTFAAYSLYYDLVYQDKDYNAEVVYLKSLLDKYDASSKSILELGCGTGRHAELLAESGFDVTGVELSKTMLARAEQRAVKLSVNRSGGRFAAVAGDARTFRTNKSFDSVMSLFHVVSYQTTNQDINKLFATVVHHLNPGGLFVFDAWYGPAVLSMRPSVRIKRIENAAVSVLRIAEPVVDLNRNVVNVQYTALVTEKATGKTESIVELHPMRYFFLPEIALLAEFHNMRIVHAEEWITGIDPSEATWGVTFVLRKG